MLVEPWRERALSNIVTLVRRQQSGGVGRVLESAVSALNILDVTRRVPTKRKQQKRFFPLKTIFLLFFHDIWID